MTSSSITPELLQSLLSPFAHQRQSAESFLKQLSVEHRLEGLLYVLQHPNSDNNNVQQQSVSKLAAVLIRRDILLLSKQEQLTSLVEPLLALFLSINSSNKKFVGDCMAEIVSCLQWIEYSKCIAVFQQVTASLGTLLSEGDTAALQFLIRTAERADKAFSAVVLPELPNLLSRAFTLGQDDLNKIMVLLHLVVVAAGVSKEPSLGYSCLLPLLQFFQQQNPEPWLITVIDLLLQASEESPTLLSSSPDVCAATVNLCLQTIQSCSSDRCLQLNAVQVITTLTAIDTVKRSLVGKDAQRNMLLGTNNEFSIISTCLEIMCLAIDNDIEAWSSEPASLNEDGIGWDEDSDVAYAELLLKQLIANFGAAAVHAVLPSIDQYLKSPNNDWKTQRAGLSAIQCCVEAAPLSFTPFVNTALEAAMNFSLNTKNPRVQYQGAMLLGVLCETASYEAVIRNAAAVPLLKLFILLSRSVCTKVSAMACLAIVSYCRPIGRELADAENWVKPYIPDVLGALIAGPLSLELTNIGVAVVKVRAIGAVACLAEVAGDDFAQFYSSVMPGLLSCSQLPTDGNHEMMALTGAALEAASIIGQSIQEEHAHMFLSDARNILDWAMPLLQNTASLSGCFPIDQLLASCARIASVMGQDYAPYAETVIPHLIARATDPDDIEFAEGNLSDLDSSRQQQRDSDGDNGSESMTVAIPGRGLTRVTINTTKIQEKAQAARAVYEHASALEGLFEPYTVRCFEAFLPLARYKFSSVIRTTACQTLSVVFDASCRSSDYEIPRTYLPSIASAICQQVEEEDPTDLESLYSLSESLCDIFRTVYFLDGDAKEQVMRNLTFDDVNLVVKACMGSMVECLKRRKRITAVLSGDEGALADEDEQEEYKILLQSEQDLLTPLVDTVGYNLKLMKQHFISIFESEVAPVLLPYLAQGNDIRARWSAICLFDDIVEHGGKEAAVFFAPHLTEAALLGIDDRTNGGDEDLKSAAIYGIAQIARYSPSNLLVPSARQIVSELAAITNMPKNQTKNIVVYENAVSCLASLFLLGGAPLLSSGYMKRETLIEKFLASLPLREDPDEAKICHAGLCDLIDGNMVDIASNCEILIRIIGETLAFVNDGDDIASTETCDRLAGILIRLQQECRLDGVQNSFASLAPDGQAAINAVLERYSHSYLNVVSP